ncbi:hypothetical protein EDC04DRAFT_2790241 [Pisolithus marmoratus]|nr:hypothetical protein EDC04DRAFT_2790241 [Pisolithus marmoratus]
MAVPTMQKTSWADDVDELDQPSKLEDYVDENGIRVTVECAINDEGKKVKITRKIKRTLQKSVVEHAGNKEGPDHATTTVGENVTLKLSAGNKSSEPEPSPEQTIKAELAKAGGGKVTCRLCKGDHFTAKCPYKDHLAGLETADTPDEGTISSSAAEPAPAATTGKYVPPSMRTRGPGEAMPRGPGAGGPGASRDEFPTLRVTNISEETQENDLRELFGGFGRIVRVYVGRDRETGIGKGFAFVSFDDRMSAQKAMDKLNGKGYDNLILSVQWSQPRPDGR